MALRFVPLSEEHLSAVRAFNRRMTEGNAPTDFLLPEEARGHSTPDVAIQWRDFIVLEEDAVRGGVLEMDQPGWLNGRAVRALNYQSPLSEGIVNRRYSSMPVQLVKFMQKRSDAVYIVGMGSPENPLPRLLKAAGWSLQAIPFLFRVHRGHAFFRELRMLHSTRLRSVASQLAAATGAGPLALRWMQRNRVRAKTAIRIQKCWGSWADEIWQQFRPLCSFAVERDQRTLNSLYSTEDSRLSILLVEQNGNPIGWSVAMNTQMSDSAYFGNLRVASILDTIAIPDAMPATAAAVDSELAQRGADLVLLNHSHESWIHAFRAAGFLSGPSNYTLGMSKTLADAIRAREGGEKLIHITRGDGDGRVHLG